MNKLIAIIFVIFLNGCASFFKDEDPTLGGTYSGCSFMTDVTESYTFNSDGTYSHYRDDRYGDGESRENGNWSISDDKITLQINQYKRNSRPYRDTTGWYNTQLFSYADDGDCISMGYSGKFCKGGSCFSDE